MQTSLNSLIAKFQGPEHHFMSFLVFFMLLFLMISIGFSYSSIVTHTFSVLSVVIFEIALCFIFSIIILITYRLEKKEGAYDNSAYVLKINKQYIESIEIKKYKKIHTSNILHLKFKRMLGGTGLKILIWPKNYDILKEYGFEFDDRVLEYYKKHKLPVILFPPALSRKERKKLKEDIEEFKRINGID